MDLAKLKRSSVAKTASLWIKI